MAPAKGYLAKLGIDSVNPITKRFDFQSESIALTEVFSDTSGIRGTRSHPLSHVRRNIRSVDGSLILTPTPIELADLLPWILGAAASVDVPPQYHPAESLPSRYITIDRETKVFTYDGCKVNRATFGCSQGEPLTVSLEIMGVDETEGNAGTFPSLTLDETTAPFMFHECTIEFDDVAYDAQSIQIVVDNFLDGNRFFNNITRSALVAHDRQVACSLSMPYGDAEALYDTGPGGAKIEATFTNGTVSVKFNLLHVVFPRESPTVPGKVEIMMPINGIAKTTPTDTSELYVELDSTV